MQRTAAQEIELADAIRRFTDPEQHRELMAHGWTVQRGIPQPQYKDPVFGARLVQKSAWRAHLAMKEYGAS